MIEELIQRCFSTRNLAHLSHWSSKSFSEHSALGDFYDSIIDDLDSIVENYQGCFGLVPSVSIPEVKSTGDILSVLKDDAKWIAKNRNKISKDVLSLQNLIDNLTSTYTTAIYKLTNLK